MSIVTTGPKLVGETITLTCFDFASRLQVGETLSSAVCTVSVFSGVDSAPGSILSGLCSISGTKALQKVTGGVAGCIYKVFCTATTSLGNTITIATYLAIVADPI